MDNIRQVFINCDARFIVPLSVVIHSLLVHNDPGKPIVIHLAHDADFTNGDSRERIRAIISAFPFAKVEFHDFTPIYLAHRRTLTFEGNPWPPLVWAFPLFTMLLPDVTGNIVYLDADMLVRKDLGELFDLDLRKGNWIAAAVNECVHEKFNHLEKYGWTKESGAYFNNGTMVVDADAYRRENIAGKMLDLLAAHPNTFYGVDQDVQNLILGERTLRLPMRWNYHDTWLKQAARRNLSDPDWNSHCPIDVLEAAVDPCIIHYMGRFKPWNYTHRPERGPYREEMETLGLLGNGLPGETLLKRIGGFFYDILHALIKIRVRARLRRMKVNARKR